MVVSLTLMKWSNAAATGVSRPEQSQGLLYKHLCNSLIHGFILCENIFTALPHSKD